MKEEKNVKTKKKKRRTSTGCIWDRYTKKPLFLHLPLLFFILLRGMTIFFLFISSGQVTEYTAEDSALLHLVAIWVNRTFG